MKILNKNRIQIPTTYNFTSRIKKSNLETKGCSEFGIDISSRAEFPIDVLSNFYPTEFVLDGIKISSMEGFLQSLKIDDLDTQKLVCQMEGLRAKGFGKKMNKIRKFDFKHLYWNNKRINRESQEYQELLDRAYSARYQHDENFRFALEYTGDRILRHTIGGSDPKRCILTEKEYIQRLTQLRDNNGKI